MKDYKAKRDFKKTPEPPLTSLSSQHGKTKSKDTPLMFVVQEHHASHLHYDFRLELDGVLKSWAVPKGPSTDPKLKRLAVEVEDHPLSYGTFEGVIPEHQYGAGQVYIWDTGIWEPRGNPQEGFKKGHLEFTIKGKRLHGDWILIKTNRPSGPKSQWLLMKRKDAYASRNDIIKQFQKPVKKARKKTAAKKKPSFISPHLAELVKKPPEGERWLHETKYDGYRIQAHIEKQNVVLYSRSGLDWTSKFSTISKVLHGLRVKNAIIDGEVVWLDERGRSDFQKLQNSLKAKDSRSLIYYVFDLLFLDGEDYREFPLIERKSRLQNLVRSLYNPLIRFSDHVEGNSKSLFDAVCAYKLEGLVSKDRESTYQSRRSSSWVKTKCKSHQEFVIGGFTSGEGARASFGALLLGAYEEGKLRYVGKVGTGFSEQSIADIRKKLLRRQRATSPFDLKSPRDHNIHWVKPELVAEITFGNWTSDRILRTPVFLGLREDKSCKDIRIEKEKALDKLGIFEDQKRRIHKSQPIVGISNPEKIFFKKEGITKLEVAKYYQDFSELILPHISGRPLALYRCPDGTEGECFFQKRLADPIPSNLIPLTIHEKGETKTFLTLDSVEGLLSLSQLAAFELHAWGCHSNHIENPDQIVMDFDPGKGTKWGQVVQAAMDLKNILDDLNLKSYVKVTGGKGLHVHIPVAPLYNWEQIKNFSKTLGREMVHRYKDLYTISPSAKAREKKVYIDYLRNGREATAVAPYSLRSSKISAVALPISWSELLKIKSSNQFTLQKTYEYLRRRKHDPWKDYFEKKQRISILETLDIKNQI